jgi:acylphosphatase
MSQMNDKEKTIEELHAVVHGYVQGVGFRDFASRRATSLGVRGYTRNRGDGSVEVVAQGTRSALESLLVALRQGPSAGEVDEVETTWRKPNEHFRSFSIRY